MVLEVHVKIHEVPVFVASHVAMLEGLLRVFLVGKSPGTVADAVWCGERLELPPLQEPNKQNTSLSKFVAQILELPKHKRDPQKYANKNHKTLHVQRFKVICCNCFLHVFAIKSCFLSVFFLPKQDFQRNRNTDPHAGWDRNTILF